MIDIFILSALAGGLFVAIIAGILGPFVIWNNMSYFGDALSHSALLGITLGILLNVNLTLSIALVSVLFAYFFSKNETTFTNDTTLGILAYCALSLAIIIASLNKINIDLMGFLFGDILTINYKDIIYLSVCALIITYWLYNNWTKLVYMSVCDELLKAEGVEVRKLKLSFSLVLALFIAIAFKIVGILLITAMLILPAACALLISKSPIKMILNCCLIGCLSVFEGIILSFNFDMPTGPTIVLCNLLLLVILKIFKKIKKTSF